MIVHLDIEQVCDEKWREGWYSASVQWKMTRKKHTTQLLHFLRNWTGVLGADVYFVFSFFEGEISKGSFQS